jgi:hypothetical protein
VGPLESFPDRMVAAWQGNKIVVLVLDVWASVSVDHRSQMVAAMSSRQAR